MQRIINHLGYSITISDSSHMGNPDTPKGSVVLWAFSAWFKVNNSQWIRLTNSSTQNFANKISLTKDINSLKKLLKQNGYNI